MKYQSRLFNFLNRGAIAFNDRLGKTARNLKIAASYGVQLLMYPFYVLVQTGRWTEKQIKSNFTDTKYQLPTQQQKAHQNIEHKQTFNTDEIVLNILEEITSPNIFSEGEEGKKKVSHIRGISCLLSDKSLVLVRENNDIFNILSKEQQEKLQQLIIAQISQSYALQGQNTKKSVSNLPLINTNNKAIIFNVKWFWQVMEWVQIGALAQKVNLFGESNLIVNNNERKNIIQKISQPTEIIINKLDNQIAKLEHEIEGEIIENEDSFNIQILIFAAIDHFFGEKNKPQNGLKTDFNRLKLKENNYKQEPDPWLTWEDLSPQKQGQNITQINLEKPLNFPFFTGNNEPQLNNNPLGNIRHKLTQQKDNFLKLLSQKKDTPTENKTENKPISNHISNHNNLIKFLSPKKDIPTENKPQSKSENPSIINNNSQLVKKEVILTTFTKQDPKELENTNNQNQENNNIEYNQQWIETEAKHIGYEKNSLEIVLSLLDKIFLIIEELVIIIARLLKKIFN